MSYFRQHLNIAKTQIFLSYFMTWLYMSLLLLKSAASRAEKDFCTSVHLFAAGVFFCLFIVCPTPWLLLRYYFIFTESSSWLCHFQLLHKTLYGNHMYVDLSGPDYACQQMEHATWFSAILHSSKTGLMTYQRKLRGDKWHRSCIGGKWK